MEYIEFLQEHWEKLGYKGSAPHINPVTLLGLVEPKMLDRVIAQIFRDIGKILKENNN